MEEGVRGQLKALLDGGQAHATFEEAVSELAPEFHGRVPDGLPYSPWQLLEHTRIAQRDILDFSANTTGTYKPLKWPEEYWPADPQPPNATAWDASVEHVRKDREAFEELLEDGDLLAVFPWGTGQNLLRQALLIGDHGSYHVGELIAVRRLLGAWKPKAGHA